jgi:arsenate reductase (thioredoxin)
VTPQAKKRVLFVCIGNSCRSQMAEGFARAYGDDVLIAASAGVGPAHSVAPDTIRAMAAKNIDLREHFPKGFRHLDRAEFDLVFNMSGVLLPAIFGPAKVVDWDVPDPIWMDFKEHCEIRDSIERQVMTLIVELRRPPEPKFRGQGSGRLPL